MTITPTATGFSAFQRCVDGKKVGFVCDAETIGQAMENIAAMISKHCAITNKSPSDLKMEDTK